MTIDERFMRRALRLAGMGRHASPNPMVGCVIVGPGGFVLGEGYHHAHGGPHAEVWALRSAGEGAARGATAYVTLEPCSFYGRTPPCVDALMEAGVAKVVIAMPDPDARVSGSSVQKMRDAGIDVSVGLMEAESRKLIAAYVKHRTTGLPWVVLKSAMTLDGKIATRTGDSKWISSAISRAAVHRQLRDRCDAILCGVGTVLADDPSLTTRMARGGRNPWRVIVDSKGRTPVESKVVKLAAEDSRTIIATTEAASTETIETFLSLGCQVIKCEGTSAGKVSLPDLMGRLGTRRDIIGVLVEAGPELAAALLADGLVDRWKLYIAPKIVGGSSAPGPIGGLGVAAMAEARDFADWRVRRCGRDVSIDALLG